MLIIITIIALGLVIFIHELGHLWAAKACGIGVHEFSIGMGPKVLGKRINGTDYNLRLLPFGGFVKLAGLDEDKEAPPIADHLNYRKKPLYKRFIVIVAGSVMNIILGYFLFTGVSFGMGIPEPTGIIEHVVNNTPAAQVGLKEGDEIIKVDAKPLAKENLVKVIQRTKGKEMNLTIKRDNKIFDVKITPEKKSEKKWILGLMLKINHQKIPLLEACVQGGVQTLDQIKMMLVSVKLLVTGQVSVSQMTGPVGIVQFASSQLDSGFFRFLNVMALITLSLGIMNLLPFPVLDGGHLMFLLLEGLRGKPLSERVELWIANIGAGLLITLMAFIILNDVIKWKERGELFKRFQSSIIKEKGK